METRKAIRITARYREFNGTLEQWKESFYELWRYQLTWGFAYSLGLNEGREGVFLELAIRPQYRDHVIDLMERLGYEGIFEADHTLGIIDPYELEDIDDVILEW